MYAGIFVRKIPWLLLIFFVLGIVFIALSCIVYLWISLLFTKAAPVACPNCRRPTKILGRVDACMYCKEPLTLGPELEGKAFDEKHNTRRNQRENAQTSNSHAHRSK